MAQSPPEDGVVNLLLGQQLQDVLQQCPVGSGRAVTGIDQTELGKHQALECDRKYGLVGLQRSDGELLFTDQGKQSLPQTKQVPVGDVGLLVERVAAFLVRVVANVAGVECIQKLKRPVVDGQTQNAHVVGVQDAMAKAHRLPLCDQCRRAFTHRLQQGCVRVACEFVACAARRVKPVNDIVGQDLELRMLVMVGKMLKVAKPDEAGRHPRHHRCGLNSFPPYRRIRADDTQGARRGNAQALHGLAAQEFADAGAQHGTPVAHAGVGRQPGAL